MNNNGFILDKNVGYFKNRGVDVMAFSDFYPVGHQSGVTIIMHGNRVASCGDIRFEQTPGQWQPTPKQIDRKLDEESNTIVTTLHYPDLETHLQSFNPMIYPDFEFTYDVSVKGDGDSIVVTVDFDRPIPEKYAGKICFNLELFPGALFGKPWIMDSKNGIFPRQPNGPTLSMPTNYDNIGHFEGEVAKADINHLSGGNKGYNPIIADDIIAMPYAVGKRFTVRPDDDFNRFTVESLITDLKLYDGRMNHNNGWFVLSSEIPVGETRVVHWVITPNVVADWLYKPVVQTSQIGYHPNQPKVAVIELDKRDEKLQEASLYKITESGEKLVLQAKTLPWGSFLRYNYVKFDFSDIKDEGLYQVRYGDSTSSIFRIAKDIYDRGVWQPVLEYFLPVQMCHMRVQEKYRVWHGLCHHDDATMAPLNCNHFDGYYQGGSTLTKYKPLEQVPGLNVGGWHDAGDFDLRVESQSGEFYNLALAFEEFGVDYDVTTIDQTAKITEIHQPDGKNDILQQIEHGVLSVVAGYNALGRLYRGIICNNLRQYVLMGDASTMTDGIPGNSDDRWVFTENNPWREMSTCAHLAAASRALKGFNDELSEQALNIAINLYNASNSVRIHPALELYLATGEEKYKDYLLSQKDKIVSEIHRMGSLACRIEKALNDPDFTSSIRDALVSVKEHYENAETPYGIPYRPHIWGAGWEIQRMGANYYFLNKSFPDMFAPDVLFNALHFILGCHPGSNTASFASGIGAKSATTAYCAYRADWSYIPGGVASGTALIRPDFPELLDFPFLWQQMEYVMGGGSSNYMFVVLAAKQLLDDMK